MGKSRYGANCFIKSFLCVILLKEAHPAVKNGVTALPVHNGTPRHCSHFQT